MRVSFVQVRDALENKRPLEVGEIIIDTQIETNSLPHDMHAPRELKGRIETNSLTHAMHAPRELKGRIETNSLTHAMHAPRELKGRIETNSLTHAMHAPRELKGRSAKAGGLVVVGSYVPGSSAQLENLLA